MASGEGKNVAAEWQKLVLKGQFAAAAQNISKGGDQVSSQSLVSIFGSSCSFIGKAQQNGSADPIDLEGLGNLTYQCAKFLAEKLLQEEEVKDLLKRTVQSVYYNSYYMYTKNEYRNFAKFIKILPGFVDCMKKLDSEEKKAAVRKDLLELGSIIWNASCKLTDAQGCPNMELCLGSLDLLCLLDQASSRSACDRASKLIVSFNRNTHSLQTITKTILPIVKANTSGDNFEKLKKATCVLVHHLLEKNMERDVMNLQKMYPKEYWPTFLSCMIPKKVVSAFQGKDFSRSIITEVGEALTSISSEEVALGISKLVVAKRVIKWKELEPEAVLALQEILVMVMEHLSQDKKMEAAVQFVLMTEAHIPSKVSVKPWEDNCSSSMKWTLAAMESIQSGLGREELLDYEIRLFNNLVYISYNFFNKANCCLEAYNLIKIFIDRSFKMADHSNLSEELTKKILNALLQGAQYISPIILSDRPGQEKKMAQQALNMCLNLLSSVCKLKLNLPERLRIEFTKKAVKVWVDVRISAAKYLNDLDKGLEHYLKHFSIKLHPDDLEMLLCLEIEIYDSRREVKALRVASDSLESMPNRSKQHRTSLAIALGKSKSDFLGDVEESATIASKLAETLQKEVKKVNSLDNSVLLILALHQEYLSSMKVTRLKHQELGDKPLTMRAPPLLGSSEEEQQTAEAWENAVELSQLGQVLCCRQESRRFKPLMLILHRADEILKMKLTTDDVSTLEPVLACMECVGLHLSSIGHDWSAVKCWNIFYLLAALTECPKLQLRALGWLVSKFTLKAGDAIHEWLLKKSKELSAQMQTSGKALTSDERFSKALFETGLAQCFANSMMAREAAEIVLRLRRENESDSFYSKEILARTFFIASQIMGCFTSKDPLVPKLADSFVENLGAALFAFDWAYQYMSSTNPVERDLTEARLQELSIMTGLWVAEVHKVCGYYKIACNTLQKLLQKLEKLHFPTRAAQMLSLLGDLDVMVPDREQVQQRLHWNEKILSLGVAITGEKVNSAVRSASPTPADRKEHQLTAWCSPRCQSTKTSCTLCKNPLYQICKAHYLFLASNNEAAFWTIHQRVTETNVDRAKRLADYAWNGITDAAPTGDGWMQLLNGPLELLGLRLQLVQVARMASKGDAEDACDLIETVSERISQCTAPIARYLESWAVAEEVAVIIQAEKKVAWDPKLQGRIFGLAPAYASGDETSRPCSPTPNIQEPAKPPSKPKRRGRKPLIDEPAHIEPPNPPKIKVIHFDEVSPKKTEAKKGPARKPVPKTVKKPVASLKERLKENAPQPPADASPLPTRARRQPAKEASPGPSTTRRNLLTTMKRPPSKFSSSSNDSPRTSTDKKIKQISKKVSVICLDDSSDQSDVAVSTKRKARPIPSSSDEDDEVFEVKPSAPAATRSRRK